MVNLSGRWKLRSDGHSNLFLKEVTMDKKHRPEQGSHSKKGSGMESRGVTRPMNEMEMRGDPEAHHPSHQHRRDQDEGHHDMSMEQRQEMLHMHHMQTLWIYWTIVLLGAWMVMSPLTFDYGKNTVQPGGGREVWLPLAERIAAMKWSDIISGALLMIFGWRALSPNRPYSMWICCFIGIWISMAPLIFWAPSAVAYLNGTLVGVLIISLTILIPGMPNMVMFMKMGSEVPSGWSYNPSSWPQRWIMIVAGFFGWIVSRYLAAFQLGYIDTMWDPFFGQQSVQVLNSAMSHSLPISDAGLGSLAYTLEFLMGYMGSPSRWRTMPWMVAFFGILVIPLGLVHIFLVISQPLVVGAWCTFCLLAAAIMLPMIPLEADEVVAMGQHVVQARKKGERFWSIFWKGGKPIEMNKDTRSPKLMEFSNDPWKVIKASLWGMSLPWTLVVSSVLGLVIMILPSAFGVDIKTTAADIGHLGGALVVVIAVICMGEVLRMGRYINVLLGVGIAILPWLHAGNTALSVSYSLLGLAIAALSIPRGPKRETYGVWDRFVK